MLIDILLEQFTLRNYTELFYHLQPADKSYFTQFEDDDYSMIVVFTLSDANRAEYYLPLAVHSLGTKHRLLIHINQSSISITLPSLWESFNDGIKPETATQIFFPNFFKYGTIPESTQLCKDTYSP